MRRAGRGGPRAAAAVALVALAAGGAAHADGPGARGASPAPGGASPSSAPTEGGASPGAPAPVAGEGPAPAGAASAPATVSAPPRYRVVVAAQLGLPHPIGIAAVATRLRAGRPLLDVDALLEPSRYLQSYSVGAAYHLAGSAFVVGPRLRWLQLHPPWSRGYVAGMDDRLGLSLEAGVRRPVGAGGRYVLSATLGAEHQVAQGSSLAWLVTLHVGLGYAVAAR